MSDITYFECPECGLGATRLKVLWMGNGDQWRCWDCGHMFGFSSNEGQLDIGVIPRTDGDPLLALARRIEDQIIEQMRVPDERKLQ